MPSRVSARTSSAGQAELGETALGAGDLCSGSAGASKTDGNMLGSAKVLKKCLS